MSANISRRPELPGDAAFVRHLIIRQVSTELGADSWPEPMRSHLLETQHSARRNSVHHNFPGAESQIIMADSQSMGWLVTASLPNEIRLIEILIEPESRGQGIGSVIIRQLLETAAQNGRPVSLSVNAASEAAIRLYERLGFQFSNSGQLQHEMHCPPPAARS